MHALGLSDSENYAIEIVETVIFTIMNTIMIVGLCSFIPLLKPREHEFVKYYQWS